MKRTNIPPPRSYGTYVKPIHGNIFCDQGYFYLIMRIWASMDKGGARNHPFPRKIWKIHIVWYLIWKV